MSDLILANKMGYVLGKIIDYVIEAGYCPYALLNEILKKHKMFIKENCRRPDLKQQLDNAFSIDASEHKEQILYSEALYLSYREENSIESK